MMESGQAGTPSFNSKPMGIEWVFAVVLGLVCFVKVFA
jgi:hypothetical protein